MSTYAVVLHVTASLIDVHDSPDNVKGAPTLATYIKLPQTLLAFWQVGAHDDDGRIKLNSCEDEDAVPYVGQVTLHL